MEAIDLKGRKALIVGVANADSLAWWAAKHLREAGADLADDRPLGGVIEFSTSSEPIVAAREALASLPLAQTSTAKFSACNALRINDAVFFSSSTTRMRMS